MTLSPLILHFMALSSIHYDFQGYLRTADLLKISLILRIKGGGKKL